MGTTQAELEMITIPEDRCIASAFKAFAYNVPARRWWRIFTGGNRESPEAVKLVLHRVVKGCKAGKTIRVPIDADGMPDFLPCRKKQKVGLYTFGQFRFIY